MDIRQLEAFLFVADKGSFSKAAEHLKLSQPTVSAHIASLESELLTKLFERHYNRATLTPVGEKLYPLAQKMIDLRDEALLSCKADLQFESKLIRIAASTIPYQYVLPIVCSEFQLQYPFAQFEFLSGDSEKSAEYLLSKRADIGLTGAIIPQEGLNYQSFMEDKLVLVSPTTEAYASLDSDKLSLADLPKYPYISREAGSGTWMETQAFLQEQGLYMDQLNIVAQLQSPDEVMQAIQEGRGISIVSQLSAQDYLRFGQIRMFNFPGTQMKRKLYIVTKKNEVLPLAARQFVNFISRKTP